MGFKLFHLKFTQRAAVAQGNTEEAVYSVLLACWGGRGSEVGGLILIHVTVSLCRRLKVKLAASIPPVWWKESANI